MKKKLIAAAVLAIIGTGAYFGYQAYLDNNRTIYELVQFGAAHKIREVVGKGIDVNAPDTEGRTLLMAALTQPDNADNIITLVNLGADVTKKYKGISPLSMAAITQKDIRVFRLFLEKGADAREIGPENATPLMLAAGHQSDPEVLKLLIAAGADVNAVNNLGQTALMLATQKNNKPEIIKALAESGANINYKNTQRHNLIAMALAAKNYKIIPMLISLGAENSRFNVMAAIYNKVPLKTLDLLTKNIDTLNFTDKEGYSPLLLAITMEKPDTDVVDILVKNGANINFANSKGFSPLMAAVKHSTEAPRLRSLEASGLYYDINKMSPKLKEQVLKERGKAYKNNLKLVKTILEHGADTNAQDALGMTALMYAAQTGKEQPIKDLLQSYGGDFYMINNTGQNMFDIEKNRAEQLRKMQAAYWKSQEH